MISSKEVLAGQISSKQGVEGRFNAAIHRELEDLVVTPTSEEQIFKSEKYGYDKVTVKGADLREDLSTELTEQDELLSEQEVTIDDIVEALKDKAGVGIALQEKSVIPTTEEQSVVADVEYDGLSKVTVAGDENLVAENIKKDVEIFGVVGTAKTSDAKITDAQYLFYYGARLEIMNELLNMCENVTNTSSMFQYCYNLTSLDLSNFDTSNVTTMQSMFNNCSGLLELNVNNFNTEKLTNIQQMLYGCSKLETLDMSSFELDATYNINNFINNASKLTNFKSPKKVGKGFIATNANNANCKYTLSGNTQLTQESLLDVINNLYDLNLTYDVANGGTLYTQQLVLGSTNLAKLTADEIAIATAKGWTVS